MSPGGSNPATHGRLFGVAAIPPAELWHGVSRATGMRKARRRQYLAAVPAPLPIIPHTEQYPMDDSRTRPNWKRLGNWSARSSWRPPLMMTACEHRIGSGNQPLPRYAWDAKSGQQNHSRRFAPGWPNPIWRLLEKGNRTRCAFLRLEHPASLMLWYAKSWSNCSVLNRTVRVFCARPTFWICIGGNNTLNFRQKQHGKTLKVC